MGESHLALKLWKTAEEQFAKILKIDPANPQARLGLARALLARGKDHQSAREALASVGQLYHNPVQQDVHRDAGVQNENYHTGTP